MHVAGDSVRILECYNQVLYPTEERKSCDCYGLIMKPISSWSPCILHQDQNSGVSDANVKGYAISGPECGVGTRYQAMGCADSQGNILAPNTCDSKGNFDYLFFLIAKLILHGIR